jgi:hypothetical protein
MRRAPLLRGVALLLSLTGTAGAQPPPPPPSPAPTAPTAPTGTFAPETPAAEPPPPAPPDPAPPATDAPPEAAPPSPPPPAETLPQAPPAGSSAAEAEEPLPPAPSARLPPRSERTLYANLAALLAIQGRGAIYTVDGRKLEQAIGGGGYELVGMLGSARNGFAFGGGASFVYVAKTDYTWEGEALEGFHPPVWALSLGPAVDYHPGRRFHIGGLVGLSLEGVPSFEQLPRKRETIPGFASALWLGFEWAVSDEWNLGVCMTGHLRQAFIRDIDDAVPEESSEASISVGLGVNVSRF